MPAVALFSTDRARALAGRKNSSGILTNDIYSTINTFTGYNIITNYKTRTRIIYILYNNDAQL